MWKRKREVITTSLSYLYENGPAFSQTPDHNMSNLKSLQWKKYFSLSNAI